LDLKVYWIWALRKEIPLIGFGGIYLGLGKFQRWIKGGLRKGFLRETNQEY